MTSDESAISNPAGPPANPASPERRHFGRTSLQTSVIGFGAWAIGGPAMAGTLPIGWGPADDATSLRALERAREQGIDFFDTADFYGLGHSEELIGRAFGGRTDVVVATKVGHRLNDDGSIRLDYSRAHVEAACDASLRRLRRHAIDLYQLHSAKVKDLEQGECLETLERLRERGKIRYWGVSLNTFDPAPEAEWLMRHGAGDAVQLVLNVLNQRAVPLLCALAEQGYGVIARMPFQFGLLTGRFTRESRFPPNDHRSFRLRPEVLAELLGILETDVWPVAERSGLSRTELSLAFCAGFHEVSTVIPGIRTPEQAETNAAARLSLGAAEHAALRAAFEDRLGSLVESLRRAG